MADPSLAEGPTVDEVVEEILRALRTELPAQEITAASDLRQDLALDSLTLTSLVVNLEDRFRIHLDEGDGEELRTITDLAALVVRRVQEQR